MTTSLKIKDFASKNKWKLIIGAVILLFSFLCIVSQVKAYETQNSKYKVILANSSKKQTKDINFDFKGGVYVTENPSVRYYCVDDESGKVYNSITPPKGTKILYREISGNKELKWWYTLGGSVSGPGWTNNVNYKVTLNAVDATATTPFIRLPKVAKDGYTFTGWEVEYTQEAWVYYNGAYRNFGGSNPGIKLGSDGFYYMDVGAFSTIRTVRPTFKPNNFYVRYHANGGSGSMADQTFTYGVTQALRKNTFTRTGYTFKGWKVQREYDNKWAWAEGTGNGEYWQSGEPWGSNIRYYSDGGNIAKTTYYGYVNMYAQWTPNKYYLDVNGLLDGTASGNTAGYGTFDVYINGSLVANDVTDFYQQYDYGTSYEIKDIRAYTGKTYNGVSSGKISGTIGTSNSVQLKFSTSSFTNSISHWMFGFKNSEGNNSNKSAWLIGNTSFSQNYNSSYVMNSSRAKTIPKGFQLASSFGTSSIDGTWKSYPMGTTVTQKNNAMSFEYDYTPITYSISYNMNGGTNNSSNPSSYNILYGVTLQNPTRKGWSFEGWYLNGKKVTGINVGANATFTSESDMYNKLNSRTSGNLTLEARWYNDPPVLDLDIDGGNPDGNPIPPIKKDDDTIVIQQNDVFTPSKYLDATDKESGEKLDITIDNKVPLDDENRAYQSGTYDVIYKATDEGGASSSFTLHVIVNEPPKITATDRIFFKGQQNIDTKELLRKVVAEDKEDGPLSDRVTIESIDYKDGRVDKNVKTLDTSKTGEFTITYTVTDNYKKTITKTATIKVVDNQSVVNSGTSSAIRFINLKFLNTLNSYSIWSTDSNYKSALLNSLNQHSAEKYSSEKIQSMRE